MDISSLRPLAGPLLFSLLLVAAALLLWRVPAAHANQADAVADDCVVLDKAVNADAAAKRRIETMLSLHRGW